MQWPAEKLVLLVGLCSAGLAGCAEFRASGDAALFGSASSPAASSDMPSRFGFSPTEPATVVSEGKSQDKTLEGQFALARLSEHKGERAAAKETYCALLKKAPKDARLHHRLGVLAVGDGDFAAAESYFATARSLAAPTAELLSDMGYCLYLQHKLPEAEATLNEALKVQPAYPAAVNNLALVYGRQGRFQASLDLFKQTNSEAEAYANVGYVLAQNGRMVKAREMYLRALTLDNSMKAAAQAALQIDERTQLKGRLAASGCGSHPVLPSGEAPGEGGARGAPASENLGQGPQAIGPEATSMPRS